MTVFEEEIGLPSGLGPMGADECKIDPAVFEEFVNALLARRRQTRHPVVQALTDGFVMTVLVPADRAGIDVDWDPPAAAPPAELRDVPVRTGPPVSIHERPDARDDGLRDRVRQSGRGMPR